MAALVDAFAMAAIWTTWKNEIRAGGNKPSKVPYALDGGLAKSNDPSTWMTYFEAEQCRDQRHHDGINIMLAPVEDGLHLGGIDLDACIGEEGDLEPWAAEIVVKVNSYTEVSPSGTGLKIFFLHDPKLTLDAKHRWRKHVQKPNPKGGKDLGIEQYLAKHFMAVTEAVYQGYTTLRTIGVDILYAVRTAMARFDDKPAAPRMDDTDRLYDAIAAMRNGDLSWEEWNTRGMAIHKATGGSTRGYEAFMAWSAQSSKFDERACRERWDNWRVSPGDQVGEGTIFHHALDAGWVDPNKGKPNGHAKPNGNGRHPYEPNGSADDWGEQRSVDKPFPGKWLAEILALELRDPLRRVAGLIGEDDYLTMIFGPSTAGKTLLVIDLVFCLLRGLPWFERKTLKCGVLYIALEGEIGFYNRLKAYVSKVIGDILPDAPFKIVTVPVDFGIDATTSQIAVAKVIATINEMNIEAQRIGAPKVGVFVLDNMRSAAPGLRENYSEEVAAFYGKCREVARATGASPIVIQNTGKDTTLGARGTQAQFDLCDTVIEISSEPRSWIATKTRDGAISKALAFALEVIDLGIVEDVDGSDKMIRSVVARPAEFPDPPAKPKPQWQRAHDVLVRTVANHGMKPPDTVNYPTTTPVITTTRFREELQKVDLLPQDPDVRLTVRARESALSVIRARYSELRKKLADKGLMSLYELYVWPTTPGPKK